MVPDNLNLIFDHKRVIVNKAFQYFSQLYKNFSIPNHVLSSKTDAMFLREHALKG